MQKINIALDGDDFSAINSADIENGTYFTGTI
jgi:hypothetical protein